MEQPQQAPINSWTIRAADEPVERFRSIFGRDPSDADLERHQRARGFLELRMPGPKARLAHVIATWT